MDTGVIGSDWDLHRARHRQIYSLLLHFMFSSHSSDFAVTVLHFLPFFIPCFIPKSVSLSLSLCLFCPSESWCAVLQCNVFSLQPCSDSPVPSVTVYWTHTHYHTHLSSWASLAHEHTHTVSCTGCVEICYDAHISCIAYVFQACIWCCWVNHTENTIDHWYCNIQWAGQSSGGQGIVSVDRTKFPWL